MLVVTTTVRVLDGIHRNTTGARPRVSLDLVLVVRVTGLEHRFVNTTTTGDNTDGRTSDRRDNLLHARWHLDPRLACVSVVGDDSAVVTRSPSNSTTVTSLRLDVADDGPLRHLAHGEHVADGETGLLTTVDELASVSTLRSNEGHVLHLVPVRVPELNLRERGTPAGVMNNALHNTLDVPMLLSVILVTELGSTLPKVCVRLEDPTGSLTLSTDDTTHLKTTIRQIESDSNVGEKGG